MWPRDAGTSAALAGTLLLVGFLASCARQVAPPGGPTDVRPPVVVATVPAAFELVTDLSTPIRFDFDERISERSSGGTLDEAIAISPASGGARVKHGRRSLTLEVEGGLRPGVVYRVTMGAVISDLFGNRMTDPFELVFSTGSEPVPTTLAGEVWDRVTGRPVSGAALMASAGDGLVHRSVADREGIYAFRYLPDGSFSVTAFDDQNRNGEVDSTEVQGSVPITLSVGDTLLVDVAMLAPDTSAAMVTRAMALDSVTVAIEFDDYLEPSAALEDVSVSLRLASDSAGGREPPGVLRLFEESGYLAYVDSTARAFATLDSLERANDPSPLVQPQPGEQPSADSVQAGDSARAAPDTVVIADPGAAPRQPPQPSRPSRTSPTRLTALQGTTPGPTRDGRRVLPGRRLVVLLATPVGVDVEYEVTMGGVRNINGLGDGGGSASFTLKPVAVDTTAVDSSGAGTLANDTARIDTLGVALLSGEAMRARTLTRSRR